MLASALHDAGRLDEAIASYEQAIRLFELASEPNGQLVGLTCHHAGVVLNKMRRYSEAKPLLERALTLYREVLPDRWPLNTLLNQVRRELKKCRVA
jgi:tetratricopeptide (TPR) repeat protein